MTATLLIADPDVPFLQALSVRLRSEGHQIHLAQDADRAVALLRRDDPDLVIANVALGPGAEGGVAVQRDRIATPLIYVSDDRSAGAEELAAEHEAAALLYKPFEIRDLLEQIEIALDVARRNVARRSA